MIAAGYTDARYQTCLTNAIPGDYAIAWHNTIVDYSFNPFRQIDMQPPQTDLAFTEGVMRLCRTTLKVRCALLNEALRSLRRRRHRSRVKPRRRPKTTT